MSDGWRDLGDDELEARLVQRGYLRSLAVELVEHREMPEIAAAVDGLLG